MNIQYCVFMFVCAYMCLFESVCLCDVVSVCILRLCHVYVLEDMNLLL